jgi:trehalose 6-phosphate synthase
MATINGIESGIQPQRHRNARRRGGRPPQQRLVIVSNRIADPRRNEQAGGLAVALSDVLRGRQGVWAGWSGRVSDNATTTPPRHWRSGGTEFVTLDLTPAERDGYYLGHANDCLWPLLHYRTDLMRFDRANLETYHAVNRRFAAMLMPLLQPGDLIWIHDYHLIPLAAELRRCGANQVMGFFLHIPFPPLQVLATLPEYRQLLRHLAAYDLIGVQTAHDLDCLRSALPAADGTSSGSDETGGQIGRNHLLRKEVAIGAFPAGIDVGHFAHAAEQGEQGDVANVLGGPARGRALIIGVERLDYTKGLSQRFKAYRRLLERHPENRRRVTLLQIAAKSREDVTSYLELRRELGRVVS